MPQAMPQVRWRKALAVLLGLCLPLPLVLVLVTLGRGGRQGDGTANVSPRLSREERLRRVTYQRPCQTSADCEAPLGCLNHWRLRSPRCTDSECVTDAQCREDHTCQILETEGGGPRVRVCLSQGVRREGEECAEVPSGMDEACAPGLRCVAGWCGRACPRDGPEGCPEGFFCADQGMGAVCLPTCESRGCPTGQQCVRFNTVGTRVVSACAVVRGDNCQRVSCPEGQRCWVLHEPRRPAEVRMACVTPCAQEAPACPPGLVCDVLFCRPPCDPQVPGQCGPERECGQYAPGHPWVCRLRW
jgi:hypothetical protein